MQNNWLQQCANCGPHHPTIDSLNAGGWRAHCGRCRLRVEGKSRAECLQKFDDAREPICANHPYERDILVTDYQNLAEQINRSFLITLNKGAITERNLSAEEFDLVLTALRAAGQRPVVRERIARAIHDGLGGDGWAYTNYGGDEWNSQRDRLLSAADAVVSAISEQPD